MAWQIDVAENNNYDSAFVYGYDACMESVHLFSKWTDIEPDTGAYNTDFIAGFLDVINIYYPAWNIEVELQIAPINTGINEVPSELSGLSFDDPLVINRFKILLDTVFAHLPDVSLAALNIGNEGDLNFGTDASKYSAYKVFLDSVSVHAKNIYFDLHGTDLKVGTTFTFHGLTDTETVSLCQSVNSGLDIVSATYYPLNNDFTMQSPEVVATHFSELVAAYPDTIQPIYLVECGYASSTLCNSSEQIQAEFWSEVFAAWDTHYDHIKYLTIFKSTDWSVDIVNQLGQYYNLQDTVFLEYLRTLGLRTWPGNGTNKQAYEQVLCELQDRNWCDISCAVTGLGEQQIVPDILVYPNPTNGLLHTNSDQKIDRIHLLNSVGQRVFTTGETTIDLSAIPAGYYLLEVVTAHRSYFRKIVKE